MRTIPLAMLFGIPCIVCHVPASGQNAGAVSDILWVYLGTYTRGGSEGIYRLRLDARTGVLDNLELAYATENPSFLAIHPAKPLLYAVGEMSSGGAVRALAIEAGTGALRLINQQPSVGKGPCHVAVSRAGRNVLCANYASGSVTVLPIDEDGRLSPASTFLQHQGSSVNPDRQQAAHAHSITLDAVGRFVFVADLGMDKIMIYRLDEAHGALTANEPAFVALKPGAGPRHFAFHPNGRFAYVVNELDNTVTAFSYDPERGNLDTLQRAGTLPTDFAGENTTAEIRVHPSGRFLYCSNRGHDSIASFAIDAHTGHITPLGHTPTGGREPRNFNIDPSGMFLLAANQNSGNVAVFRIAADTGGLTLIGSPVEAPTPVCVAFAAPF